VKVRVCFGYNTAWYAILVPIIKYFDRFPASHSWIEIETDLYLYIFESVWPKSRRVSKNFHTKTYKTVREFELKIPDHVSPVGVIYWLQERIHEKPYSFLQLIVILFQNIFPVLVKPLAKAYVNGKRADICTELCANFLNTFYQEPLKESTDVIGLRDLYRMCLNVKKRGY
jgi:hypothetical protein